MHSGPYILLSPYSHNSAKNYPFFQGLIDILPCRVMQLGRKNEHRFQNCDYGFDLKMYEIEALVKEIGNFISVDSFLPHLAHHVGVKGNVLFGPSNPRIFGYSTNNNIIMNEDKLRVDQFGLWRDYKWAGEWLKPTEMADRIVL
jgi:ADP-heptose:LPS heptosyltransferase